MLIGKSGKEKGKRYAIEFLSSNSTEYLIGREKPNVHLWLDSKTVSKKHAAIHERDGVYSIKDMKSRNHTYLDGKDIYGKGEFLLDDGARIEICGYIFEFRTEDSGSLGTGDYRADVSAALSQSSAEEVLQQQPAAALNMLLELTKQLTRLLDEDKIIRKVGSQLLDMFPKADRVLIFVAGEDDDDIFPHWVQSREENPDLEMGYSRTLVRECLETGDAIVGRLEEIAEEWKADSITHTELHSVMCAPLLAHGDKPLGVIQLDTRIETRTFTEDDLPLLMGVSQQTAAALEQVAAHRELVAFEALRAELDKARQLQLSFLPQEQPRLEGYELLAYYEAAKQVGGDYYDFFGLEDGRVLILNGDVSGKAMPAALFLSRIAITAGFVVRSDTSLSSIMTRLNRTVCQHGGEHFMTMLGAILDPKAHRVTFANAGHNLPLLYSRKTREVRDAMTVAQTGLVLGVDEDEAYPEVTVTLDEGESLLLFSDGLIDAVNADGKHFDREGVLATLGAVAHSPRELLAHLVGTVETFSAGCDQFDDISIVCFGRK